jgi:hypothetical protein
LEHEICYAGTAGVLSSAFFDDSNGGRLVLSAGRTFAGISKLPYGVAIGTSLGAAYQFHAGGQRGNSITLSDGYTGNAAASGGWTYGDTGYFGFKFTSNAGVDTHFGWGEMRIADRGNAGGAITLRSCGRIIMMQRARR